MIYAAFVDELIKIARRKKKKSSALGAALRGAQVGAGAGALASLLANKVSPYTPLAERMGMRAGGALKHGLAGSLAGGGLGLALHHILGEER